MDWKNELARLLKALTKLVDAVTKKIEKETRDDS